MQSSKPKNSSQDNIIYKDYHLQMQLCRTFNAKIHQKLNTAKLVLYNFSLIDPSLHHLYIILTFTPYQMITKKRKFKIQ